MARLGAEESLDVEESLAPELSTALPFVVLHLVERLQRGGIGLVVALGNVGQGLATGTPPREPRAQSIP